MDNFTAMSPAALAFTVWMACMALMLFFATFLKEVDRSLPVPEPKKFDVERYDVWICDVCWKEYSNVEFLCIIACTNCGRDCQHFTYENRKHENHQTQTG